MFGLGPPATWYFPAVPAGGSGVTLVRVVQSFKDAGEKAINVMEDRLSRKARVISPDDASRALYVDFEGEKAKPPVLLGCANRLGRGAKPWVWQAVTDPPFGPLAATDGIELLALPEAVERILRRAERKDRLIVAWSEHELDVVEDYCPKHLDRFQARFVNARTFAVHWRNKCHGGGKPATNMLGDYLALIGYEVSEGAGPGRAGETIRVVRKALEKGRGIAGMTENQLRRWRDLREHNLHDCAGMRAVCLKAAREVAARASLVSGAT